MSLNFTEKQIRAHFLPIFGRVWVKEMGDVDEHFFPIFRKENDGSVTEHNLSIKKDVWIDSMILAKLNHLRSIYLKKWIEFCGGDNNNKYSLCFELKNQNQNGGYIHRCCTYTREDWIDSKILAKLDTSC